MDPDPIQVVARRQKAFQGWRYLKPEDAPLDLNIAEKQVTEIPVDLENELRELGLI